MRTLQTPMILNEVLNTSRDKCEENIKALHKIQKELEHIIDIGLIELDYTSLDANKVLEINESLHSMEEDLYSLFTTAKQLYETSKGDLEIFG